jgi:phosphate starvation-inducible PhoH-like protein
VNEEVNDDVRDSKRNYNQTNSLKLKIDNLKTITPLTENQRRFFDAYKQGDYFIALLGSAGSGKSFIAMYKILEEIMDKGNSYSKLVIVRSAVPTRDQGFLPGTLSDKMEVYEEPYDMIAQSLFGRKDAYSRLKEQSYVEFISTSNLRGCTFDNAIVMFDEIQNANYAEISTVITRIGNNSKLIMCGDFKQNDLIYRKNDTSGFLKFIDIAKSMSEFTEIVFTIDDIVRSDLVKAWIIAEEVYESGKFNR